MTKKRMTAPIDQRHEMAFLVEDRSKEEDILVSVEFSIKALIFCYTQVTERWEQNIHTLTNWKLEDQVSHLSK